MESNWAAEHLQVIRTLMERSAIYRRALAPVMLLLGILGILAAVSGFLFRIESGIAFSIYWLAVSTVGVSGAYAMVRRQALNAAEPFWSPPTRRVTQAVLPPLSAGLVLSVLLMISAPNDSRLIRWLLPIWMILYGCALHAAGFFMPRGMKLFGWVFILSGCAIAAIMAGSDRFAALSSVHLMMGIFFGGLHLSYGVYLYFTEPRKNET